MRPDDIFLTRTSLSKNNLFQMKFKNSVNSIVYQQLLEVHRIDESHVAVKG